MFMCPHKISKILIQQYQKHIFINVWLRENMVFTKCTSQFIYFVYTKCHCLFSKSINYVLNIWRYAVLSLDNCIIEIVISMSSFAIPRRLKVTRISKFYSDKNMFCVSEF